MKKNWESSTSNGESTYLVSSAIEATWPSNQTVVFLGQWCLRYSRREVWSSLDYSVAPYHWDDRAQIPKDLEYINGVYETMLPELARVLNGIHGVDYSVRYWRIVLGWWLFYFAQIFFDRWRVINAADEAYPNARLLRVPTTSGIPASSDMLEFLKATVGDSWNERLSAEIAMRWTSIEVDDVADPILTMVDQTTPVAVRGLGTSVRGRVFARVTPFMNWLGRRRMFYGKGIALYSDYLRPMTKLKLAIMLRQIPTMNLSRQLPNFAVSIEKRKWTLSTSGTDAFASALAELIPFYLPMCYLEGYTEVSKIAESSGPIHKPRVIMTANAFASDDLWKIWAASEVEKGAKLIVAQHGGHYGAGAWSSSQSHEVAICDRYLSWGWRDFSQPKVYPAPATKLVGMKRGLPSRSGKCLQVTCALPSRSYWMYSVPVGPQVNDYLGDQLCFAAALSDVVRESLVVRLFAQDYGWDVADRWRDEEPLIETDSGQRDHGELLKDTRLYVATYNATTFLESFTQGIPTVIFWNPQYWELSKDAEPYFDVLRQVSVLFDDPISCANHVNAIWNDVPGWWSSSEVQAAVSYFSEKFAYVGPKPIRELKEALTRWV
jgi:putative transferase (TIGR04331 family)